MAGIAKGNPANVSVDSNGYLHLKITNQNGAYTAAELFSQDQMGFGTYQWQIVGPVDHFDKSTVLGLFPYGPAAHRGIDGENELDIEFSQWDDTCNGCNADFTFYPATGYKSVGSATDNFHFDLHGQALSTARLIWTPTRVTGILMNGLQSFGTTQNVLRTFTFTPADYATRIPQTPLPVGINFWSFHSFPAANQEVVVRDFQFVPQ